jgi:RNA polymerase sigma factor (sigma-70 family)
MQREDADLVAESLTGNRNAFRQIVERYQVLICSVAYSATGDVTESEDVAQETFLTAWTRLRSLREPEKLRSWLCGIARNRVQRSRRDEQREPVRNAESWEAAHDSPANESLPSEQAINREEEAILWRSLEKIPELYREPLILFYREHQSIEHVAVALELTEDAVKQRLSRGRKRLQEEVQAFVEKTLRRTAPGEAFSNAVLAGLPLAAGPAVGAGVGAKGTAAAKSGFLASLATPFIGILAGIGAQWLIIRATTDDRNLRIKKLAATVFTWVAVVGIAVGGEKAVHAMGRHFEWGDRRAFAATAIFWWVFVMGLQMLWMATLPRTMAFPNADVKERGKPRAPMKPFTLAAVVIGVHLALFSSLIRLAGRAHDFQGAAIIAGVVALLSFWVFLRIRRTAAADVARISSGHLALCVPILVTIFNLRFDVWLAASDGISLAELHRRLPIWIVPLLSAAFLIGTGLLLALMKRERSALAP